MLILAIAAMQLTGQGAPLDGLEAATTCYLAETKRLAISHMSEREVAAKVADVCEDEIRLAGLQIFPDYPAGQQKLLVSIKGRVVEEVRELRRAAHKDQGKRR